MSNILNAPQADPPALGSGSFAGILLFSISWFSRSAAEHRPMLCILMGNYQIKEPHLFTHPTADSWTRGEVNSKIL
ncbi:MAG TPA: hypothetical protein VJ964_08605 [Balneolaceae bacterium]|nr:hypothetical protein [Balneolaceae bacterium]